MMNVIYALNEAGKTGNNNTKNTADNSDDLIDFMEEAFDNMQHHMELY